MEGTAPRSRADIYAELTRRLRAWPAGQALPPGLPPRLFVFGISSMPMQQVELLATLGEICEVLLLAQNPSRQAWDHLQGQRQRLAAAGRPGQDRDDLHLDGHPLLAAWGQQGRDYLHLLDRFDEHERHRDRFSRVELFHDPLQGWPDHASAPVLAQIQAAILDLEAPGAAPRPLAPGDDSLGFAICHGPQREVEVLHDRLLAWFNAPGSRLQARDVVVMVPDMAEFAPHVDAVFGRFPPGDARHIPYAVADRSPREQPLARALEQLLQPEQKRKNGDRNVVMVCLPGFMAGKGPSRQKDCCRGVACPCRETHELPPFIFVFFSQSYIGISSRREALSQLTNVAGDHEFLVRCESLNNDR